MLSLNCGKRGLINILRHQKFFATTNQHKYNILQTMYPTQWQKVVDIYSIEFDPVQQPNDALSELQDIFVDYNGMNFYTQDWDKILKQAKITNVDQFIDLYKTTPDSVEFVNKMRDLVVITRRLNWLNISSFYGRQHFDIDDVIKQITEIKREKCIRFTFIGTAKGETMLSLYYQLAKHIDDGFDNEMNEVYYRWYRN